MASFPGSAACSCWARLLPCQPGFLGKEPKLQALREKLGAKTASGKRVLRGSKVVWRERHMLTERVEQDQ